MNAASEFFAVVISVLLSFDNDPSFKCNSNFALLSQLQTYKLLLKLVFILKLQIPRLRKCVFFYFFRPQIVLLKTKYFMTLIKFT